MKNLTEAILIAAFLIMAFLYVGARNEAKRLKAEVKRYEELYLNCKINHDLHMKEHEGEFQFN